MTRARLVIVVRSICCAKFKGVDHDELAGGSGRSEADRYDSPEDASESP